jgi:hypothetical protein
MPLLSSCICIPQVFTTIFESVISRSSPQPANKTPNCESEERVICLQLLLYEEDNEAQVLANWHSGCDDFRPLPQHSRLWSQQYPRPFVPVLSQYVRITSACKSSYYYTAITQSSQFMSCICQSPLLSAASVGEFDGNITCLGEPAALSNYIDL